jgi:uncharacterized repeat protein (TIGR01451 family)
VRRGRLIIVLLLLGLGALGAYFGVVGQELGVPWPPPPITPPPDNTPVREIETPRHDVQARSTLPKATPPDLLLVNYEQKVAAAAAPPVKAPPSKGPIIVNVPDEKPVEPLIVLPPLDPGALDPKTITSASPTPPPPGPLPITAPAVVEVAPTQSGSKSPVPDLIIVPDVQPNKSAKEMPPVGATPQAAPQVIVQPAPTPILQPTPQPVQSSPPVQEPPAKLKSFQLVNPLRSPGGSNNVAPPLPEPYPVPPPFPQHEQRVVPAQPVAQVNPLLTSQTGASTSTPQVSVEKRATNAGRAGEPSQFTITVRNIGATTANQVRVEDEIPAGARVVFAEPQASQESDRAVWVLPTLAPGAEKQLKIELQAAAGSELTGVTSVTVSALTGARNRVQVESSLTLSIKTPNPVPVGFPVAFEVAITNRGREPATGLVLHCKLPAGLQHPAGKVIEADIADIGPGQTKKRNVNVKALSAGKQTIEMRVTTQNGQEATGTSAVQVNKAAPGGVSIRQAPNVKVYLDKEADLKLQVTNMLTQDLQNVAVMDVLPDGVEFISASDQGLFRSDSRTAHWLINNLAPGQTQSLTVRVKARASGHFDNEAIARTESQQEIQSTSKIQVQAISDLSLTVTESDNPLELGKSTVYEIRIFNKGSATATGVQVRATLPAGMMPAQVRGPSAYRWEGKQVVFDALPKLAAQGQAVFYVSALAQGAGDQRFVAQLTSDQNTQPLMREVRTYVYRD